MSVIISILLFLVSISILVAVHEWGHFIVARCCGVKTLRFSIGFGKVIWRKVTRSGLEIAVSAIPLGGYVKFLDENGRRMDYANGLLPASAVAKIEMRFDVHKEDSKASVNLYLASREFKVG